jgi:transcriptional regulator with XRE-family HTH domain
MPRPTSRKKSAVSLALTALRESLGDTQQQFAVRLNTSVVTVARWETSHEPTAKTLERLLKLAKKHRHAESTKIFETALSRETDWRSIERRIGQIRDRFNLKAATHHLELLVMATAPRVPVETPEEAQMDIQALADVRQLRLEELQAQLSEVREAALKLADLIAIGGRKDYLGDKQK